MADDTFDRVKELRELYQIARDSLSAADPDKRAPLIARAESIALQIASLTPTTAKAGDSIDEIAQRRAARGAGSAKSQRRPAAN